MNTESNPIYRARSISTVQEAIDEARSWARLADEDWHDGRHSTLKTTMGFADIYIRLAQAMVAVEALSVQGNQSEALRTALRTEMDAILAFNSQSEELRTALQTEMGQ